MSVWCDACNTQADSGWSADGLCVIEIGLPAFGVSDESSGFEVAHAAWMIINTCVADLRHEGGRMDGVGMLFFPLLYTLPKYSA